MLDQSRQICAFNIECNTRNEVKRNADFIVDCPIYMAASWSKACIITVGAWMRYLWCILPVSDELLSSEGVLALFFSRVLIEMKQYCITVCVCSCMHACMQD